MSLSRTDRRKRYRQQLRRAVARGIVQVPNACEECGSPGDPSLGWTNDRGLAAWCADADSGDVHKARWLCPCCHSDAERARLPSEERRRRRRARDRTREAVRKGVLRVPDCCEICDGVPENVDAAHVNAKGLTAHHLDYSAVLSVIWVCSPCHGKIHRRQLSAAHRERYERIVARRSARSGDRASRRRRLRTAGA